MATMHPALLPFAKAPEVADLLRLIDVNWFGSLRTTESGKGSEASGEVAGLSRARRGSGSAGSLGSGTSGGGSLEEGAPRREAQAAVPQQQRVQNGMRELQHEDPGHSSLEGLGTWGARQQVFLGRTPPSERPQGRPGVGRLDEGAAETDGEEEEEPVSASPTLHFADNAGVLRPTPYASARRQEDESEEEERQAAWRWRFSKKWHMEQVRQQTSTPSKDEDEWADALDYMAAATTGGLDMQFGRTTSMDRSNSTEPSMSMSQSLSLLLEASTSAKESPGLRHEASLTTPNATKRIFSAMRKAEELAAHQREITRNVEARWQNTEASQPWVGAHLPGVTIDSWGSFQFVLVRVSNNSSRRQKLLLRGRNSVRDAALFQAVQQEVARSAAQHGLPAPRAELLGSGLMQWSRERERCLDVSAQKLHKGSADAGLQTKDDLARVAGSLALTGLPPNHTVFVNGEKLV